MVLTSKSYDIYFHSPFIPLYRHLFLVITFMLRSDAIFMYCLSLCRIMLPLSLFLSFPLFLVFLSSALPLINMLSFSQSVHRFIAGGWQISALHEVSDATGHGRRRGGVRPWRTGGMEQGCPPPHPRGEDEAGSSGRTHRHSCHQCHRYVTPHDFIQSVSHLLASSNHSSSPGWEPMSRSIRSSIFVQFNRPHSSLVSLILHYHLTDRPFAIKGNFWLF